MYTDKATKQETEQTCATPVSSRGQTANDLSRMIGGGDSALRGPGPLSGVRRILRMSGVLRDMDETQDRLNRLQMLVQGLERPADQITTLELFNLRKLAEQLGYDV